MFSISKNYIIKSIDWYVSKSIKSNSLSQVNTLLSRGLKVIETSQNFFSKVGKCGAKISCAGLVVSIALPPLIVPVLVIGMISAVALKSLDIINRLEKQTINLRNRIYISTTFPDINKLDLDDKSFPNSVCGLTSERNELFPCNNYSYLLTKPCNLIQEYGLSYQKITEKSIPTLEKKINELLDQLEEVNTKEVRAKDGNSKEIQADGIDIVKIVKVERKEIDAKSLDERVALHEAFFLQLIKEYAYNQYHHEYCLLGNKQVRLMTESEYRSQIQNVIKDIK